MHAFEGLHNVLSILPNVFLQSLEDSKSNELEFEKQLSDLSTIGKFYSFPLSLSIIWSATASCFRLLKTMFDEDQIF